MISQRLLTKYPPFSTISRMVKSVKCPRKYPLSPWNSERRYVSADILSAGTVGTRCCMVPTRPEFDFSLARIWPYMVYMVYFGRVHFQLNFTRWMTGQAWWFLNNIGFSTCQTRWSTFCLNFSQCNMFNSFVQYCTIP